MAFLDNNGVANLVADLQAKIKASFAKKLHIHAISDVTNLQDSLDHKAPVGIGIDTAIAAGDKLVMTDNSDGSRLKRSPIAFGSGTTTFLRNDGTWGTPSGTYSHPAYDAVSSAAVKVGRDATGHVVIGSSITASDVGAAEASHTHTVLGTSSTANVEVDAGVGECGSEASGNKSHAQNEGTVAARKAQTALGRYNIEDVRTETFTGDGTTTIFYLSEQPSSSYYIWPAIDGVETRAFAYDKNNQRISFNTAPASGAAIAVNYALDAYGDYALIIGNGTDDSNRSNALTVGWNGIPEHRNPNNDWGTVFDLIYPVGSIYMSVNSASPATLFGGTWERITGKFLLAATDDGSSGASQAAGNTGGAATVTLTAAQSGVPAHSHGLNSHTHGMNHKHVLTSHSHGLNEHTHTLSSHTHGEKATSSAWLKFEGRTDWSSGSAVWAGFTASSSSAAVQTGGPSTNTSGKASGNTEAYGGYTGNSITTGSSASAGNTGRTSTDAASGSTASNTAADASSSHNNMPPYLSVYMWKRIA